MRISFAKHSGRPVPTHKPLQSVELSSLSAASAATLSALAESALRCDAPASPCREEPEGMSYTIMIEEGGRSTALCQSDAAMSPPFAELLEWLEQHFASSRS